MTMGRNGAPPPGEDVPDPDDERLSENDQPLDDSDQTLSDADQTLSDSDQTLSDREQQASDDDQAASDWGREHGVDSASHARTTAVRARTARDRLGVGHLRDETASQREQAASQRDELAAERDREAAIADQTALELDGSDGGSDKHTVQELRARELEGRKRAALDRERAARDRRHGARDRELAARDREQARLELQHGWTDELTGARRRDVGLEELRREIDRARRTGQSLVVAYVDVDGAKAGTDHDGHSAGDGLLREVAEGLRHHMRSYDLLVRLGGDEFLCVLAGVSADALRRRFDDLGSELSAGPAVGAVSIGLCELRDGEGAQELIARAKHALVAGRSE